MADEARIRRMEELLKDKSEKKGSVKDAQLTDSEMRMLKEVVGGDGMGSSRRLKGEDVERYQRELKAKEKVIAELRQELEDKQRVIRELEKKLSAKQR